MDITSLFSPKILLFWSSLFLPLPLVPISPVSDSDFIVRSFFKSLVITAFLRGVCGMDLLTGECHHRWLSWDPFHDGLPTSYHSNPPISSLVSGRTRRKKCWGEGVSLWVLTFDLISLIAECAALNHHLDLCSKFQRFCFNSPKSKCPVFCLY